MNSICVIGAGTMGTGIAQVAAMSGFDCILHDTNPPAVESAKTSIRSNLIKLAEKQKITRSESDEIFKRIHFAGKMGECTAGIIIEAIAENLDAKIELFKQLQKINKATAIFATNTSSLIQISITMPIRWHE